MRFLQTEWHRHERDRNAWEIERAEMKSRISKLEGDGRTSKRLQETLGKHVKILENALKREREKCKKLQAGESAEEKPTEGKLEKEDVKGKAQASGMPSCNPSWDPSLTCLASVVLSAGNKDEDDCGHGEIRQDIERDKSRLYLSKCVQEVTYHVVPPTVAQQAMAEESEQQYQNHQMQNHISQQSLEEMYANQRKPQQQPNHVAMMGPSAPNYHPPPVPRVNDLPPLARSSQAPEHTTFMTRTRREGPVSEGVPVTSIEAGNPAQPNYGFNQVIEEQVKENSQGYEAYPQQNATRPEPGEQRASAESGNTESDDWNFDDNTDPPQEGIPPPEFPSPQRPDTDAFPPAQNVPLRSPPRGPTSSRRKSSISKRRQSDGSHELRELSLSQGTGSMKGDLSQFKVRFALRGHLDVVRSVIFTGGGTPSEPEVCTTGDDGVIKRWIIPASYTSYGPHAGTSSNDLDLSSYFTHRGHTGAVMCLAASPASQNFLNGGRALGDGWVFSGGQDTSVRVWERGRVDPKATLDGHTDAVWAICVLPGLSSSVLGDQSSRHGGADRMLLASGSADGTILIWAVSSPPQLTSPSTGSRRGAGGSRRANSVSSGSNFPSSPQPSTATSTPFHYSLVHRIERVNHPSPTCISPLSMLGETFVVSYNDASVLIFDTRTAEELVGMASQETYDGSLATGVNAVAATTAGLEGNDSNRAGTEEENISHSATGSSSGVEGMVLSGHEDRYIRFFDANSGTLNIN